MIVLVCGGRDYRCYAHVAEVLDKLFKDYPDACIVQGGADGADRMAQIYCYNKGRPCLEMDATWDYYQRSAGRIRNGWMLKYVDVKMVLAFPGGSGTADMKRQASMQKIPIYDV